MVAVAVAADNLRQAVATIATDSGTWGNDGGGGGVSDEPDIVFQGTTAQSRKVSTSRIGRSYTHGTGTSMTATDRRHYLAKVNVTNYGALLTRSSPAAGIKIGSGSGAYYEYYVFGSDNYPTLGGWQIIPISPNVSGYRDATSGSPTLTSVLYWSLLADFSATSKSENLVIDAIDIGRGLKLTGGDGASTDGVFADFESADQGTSNNRWGYVTTDASGAIYFVIGELAIGENTSETAVATVFQDTTGQVLVWGNGYAETGFHRFRVNLGNATTDVDITGATFDSVGKANNDADRGYTTTEDTRLTVEVTGTSGALGLHGCVVKNTRLVTLTSAVTIDGGCDIETPELTQSSADISDSIIRTTSASGVAVIDDPTFGTTTDLHDVEFIQEGSGHAIEITSPGTYDLTGILFTGYSGTPGTNLTPSSGSNAAAVYNNSGGAVTINVGGGGDSPSVRNAASSTTTVNNTVTLTLEDVVVGSNCYIEALTGGPETVGTVLMNKVAVPSSHGYVALDGTGDTVETLENADPSSTSHDFEIVAYVRLTDWTPTANQWIAGQWETGNQSWRLGVTTGGALILQVHNGTASTTFTGSALGVTDATYRWVRVVYDRSQTNPATFYDSADGVDTAVSAISWTSQGNPTGLARDVNSVTIPIVVGAVDSGTPAGELAGRIAYVAMWTDDITQTTAPNQYFEADWRTGPDFVLGDSLDDERADDWQDGLTWRLTGNAAYTTAATTPLDVTASYAYTSAQPVVVRVRKSSNPTRYLPYNVNATIGSGGLNVPVSQTVDPIAA